MLTLILWLYVAVMAVSAPVAVALFARAGAQRLAGGDWLHHMRSTPRDSWA